MYMQYGLKIRDERKEAKEEGRAEGRVEGRAEGRVEATIENLKSIMETFHVSLEQALAGLKIPKEKYGFYISQIN